MASALTLTVNGAKQVVTVAPETPWLFVLRNELKSTGPRLGCGMAHCGACSVLLDAKEIRACITPVSYAVGKQVTTIEGLPAVWAVEKGLGAAVTAAFCDATGVHTRRIPLTPAYVATLLKS